MPSLHEHQAEIERIKTELEVKDTGLFYFILKRQYSPEIQPVWLQNAVVYHANCGEWRMEESGNEGNYYKIPVMSYEPRVRYNAQCWFCELRPGALSREDLS